MILFIVISLCVGMVACRCAYKELIYVMSAAVSLLPVHDPVASATRPDMARLVSLGRRSPPLLFVCVVPLGAASMAVVFARSAFGMASIAV
jgi:hypothetical protein